ncbi:peptidylprolyl isomerase [Jejuia pallidilutea]|uniref:Survival protein SurA n=1 Tax=Jejuia pallidilutea TaxID=504487 RepID=A0A090W6K1_9FLAO|nr:peptidylprolyl isomerase [Jejuia pallidilutea]GAL72541.1 survival protein SurA precursor [Jejuia pallidilutea]
MVQDESQKDVDEYLKLFTNYKLKLKEAKAQGLHEKPSYKRELESYKKQLAKNYMTDAKVNDALVEEAYNHISNDIKANHILVRLAEDASPQDTLVAYNKIRDLRKRAVNEGFEIVRKQVHNGKTVFGEELGWFSGFRMVYKFEKVAYNTPVGEISEPFRTRFGYHIVKVFDKRKARGERTVKHIMISTKQGDTSTDAETRIKDIYTKIKQGETFEDLAKEFSDDKNSAPSGGLLKPFSSGQLSVPEFEEAAFALQNKGDISEPIKTNFGWHIIKLENAKPIGAFKELKPELEDKVKRDARSQLIEEALISKLKDKYGITNTDLSYFKTILNEDFYKRNLETSRRF